jgi:hypothetical protein
MKMYQCVPIEVKDWRLGLPTETYVKENKMIVLPKDAVEPILAFLSDMQVEFIAMNNTINILDSQVTVEYRCLIKYKITGYQVVKKV